ncbi:phosphotransferase enzyme family protein [Amycolatopsis rubida]|uniref:Phosphotransferase enzyme family protein n=1 Tax=Amycolatopsis rubida TaxID=112413 RepID=A0A1I5EVT9_9PSEU|nr:aminoglycoside phosphotransferase family protein [Amycolatopsis rubida]SFO15648.1 Phosphotransferase enzyme family protein [Amycolatopsis rubida]
MLEGRFTPAKLRRVLTAVCARLGFDPAGARLLRFTNNAVFALHGAPVVVRIVGSTRLRHRVGTVVRVAEHFARHEVPAVRLLAGVEQPLDVHGHLVTVWDLVPFAGPPPTPADLAGLLRQVHALPPPEGLPEWEPLRSVEARVADAEELAEADQRFLLERCAQVQDRLDTLDFPLTRGFVHGDAHPGNVLPGPEGPVLCDFDSSCVGPPEWDLTPLAVGRDRFGDPPARYAEFAAAYGFDVTVWPGFSVLRAVRELKLTTSVLPILRSHPPVRAELRRRLADLRAGRTATAWTRYR